MDAAKGAVRQEDDRVSRARAGHDGIHDGADLGRGAGPRTDGACEPVEVEALALGHVRPAERRQDHVVGGVEGALVLLLVQRAASGRAAGLEGDPERALRVPGAQGPQRLVDRRRMVREVVVDAYAVGLTQQVLPAPHPLERREVRSRLGDARPEAGRARRDGRDRVTHVVRAGHLEREAPEGRAADEEVERLRSVGRVGGGGAEPGREHVPRVLAIERVPLDPRARLGAHDVTHPCVARVADEEPALGHCAHESTERRLVRRRIGVDVDVVVLDAGDDRDVVGRYADVVDELRPLLPEDGVVFVALDDERGAAPVRSDARRAHGGAARQALGQAADEPAGLVASAGEEPGAHRARSRLAVRPGHDERPAAGEKEGPQGRRHRRALEPQSLRRLRLGVVLADGVADDHEVEPRAPLDVGCVVALQAADARRLERGPDRRVERDVGPAHLVPRGRQQARRARPSRCPTLRRGGPASGSWVPFNPWRR